MCDVICYYLSVWRGRKIKSLVYEVRHIAV